MKLLEAWVHTPLAGALGWTLVHSLWQAAAAALVLAAALCFLTSARSRYAAACIAMLAILAGFGVTLTRLASEPARPPAPARSLTLPDRVPETDGELASPVSRRAAGVLPWLGPLWMAGVLIFYVRSLAAFAAARRLRRVGVCCAPDYWRQQLTRLSARLGITRPVQLLESCLTEVPVVIGHLRPVILMPLGMLAGMPAGQVEAILLHELAHIRRLDYLVNWAQACAEGLLFYHPAVWWISFVIRAERENCCDDSVVAARGGAHEYASALAALEHQRSIAREAALAATGGNLVKRIRRLLHHPEPRAAGAPVILAGVLTIAAALSLAGWQAKPPAAMTPDETPYQRWLTQDVAYIVTNQERATFRSLLTDAEREKFIEQFWQRRDPTPATAENEYKEEHYRRIAYANAHYAAEIAGWKTDRGRVYIVYGPADEIESHPAGGAYTLSAADGGRITTVVPFEQWRYRYIEGVGYDVILEFIDPSRTGRYQQTMDPKEKERSPLAHVPGELFYSREPGARVTLEVTTSRRVEAHIPIEFDAAQYEISGRLVAENGGDVSGFSRAFSQRMAEFVYSPSQELHPGAYRLNVTVQARAGDIRKTYSVLFFVK